MTTEEARGLNAIMDEKDDTVYNALSNWDISATVITVGAGSAIVHLPTDPTGTNITVQNPLEISLEAGDQIWIRKLNGSISNAYVLFRKTINFNDIYVDYATGTDAFGRDSSGNLYGSVAAPFKTLDYASKRLPKFINKRTINIYYGALSSAENVGFDSFYGGGKIIAQPLSGTLITNINTLTFAGCSNVRIEVKYLGAMNTAGHAFYIYRSNDIILNYCETSVSSSHYGIVIFDCSKAIIKNCTISNKYAGIFADTCSDVSSIDNGGNNTHYGLFAQYNSTIGKGGTQPTGTVANEGYNTGSIIR